jgi:hypothetical protein
MKKFMWIIPALTVASTVADAQELKFKGDVRIREEYIDEEGKDSRNRLRLRLRFGGEAKVNDEVKAGFRVASGNDDPVSTNQTFDDSFSSKDVKLDLAYLAWTAVEGVTLTGGKMANPLSAAGTSMVWDDDLTPEGISANLGGTLSDGVKLDVNAGGFVLDEQAADDEVMLYGGTAALVLGGQDGAPTTTIGGGYFQYDGVAGHAPFYDGKTFGNSSVKIPAEEEGGEETLEFAGDYSIAEGFARVGMDAGVPVEVFGHYAVNTDAVSDEDTAYTVGVVLGKAKDPDSLELEYAWRSVEKDAVFGTFTDSDFAGGGTDGEGHILKGKYMLAKNYQLGTTVLLTEKAMSKGGTDYTRVQVDFGAKF